MKFPYLAFATFPLVLALSNCGATGDGLNYSKWLPDAVGAGAGTIVYHATDGDGNAAVATGVAAREGTRYVQSNNIQKKRDEERRIAEERRESAR